ncbi:hypothetical protein LIA77_01213 [Sarocladium implicatum]|nr:hypothetical protein LIA77_01213 [Sarocladium implicatum]
METRPGTLFSTWSFKRIQLSLLPIQPSPKYRTVSCAIPSFLVPNDQDSFLPDPPCLALPLLLLLHFLSLITHRMLPAFPATAESARTSSPGLATQTLRGSLDPWLLVRLNFSVCSAFLTVAHYQLQLARPASDTASRRFPSHPEHALRTLLRSRPFVIHFADRSSINWMSCVVRRITSHCLTAPP